MLYDLENGREKTIQTNKYSAAEKHGNPQNNIRKALLSEYKSFP